MTTDPTTAPVRVHVGDAVISGSSIVYDAELTGVFYTYEDNVEGWDDAPSTTSQTTPRVYNHGAWGSPAFLAERNLVINIDVVASTPLELEDAIEKLMNLVPLEGSIPFVMHRWGRIRHVRVKQGGKPTVDWSKKISSNGLEARVSLQLVALDPRKLSGDGTGPTTNASTDPIGGGGSVSITNAGRGVTPPVVISVYDCANPTISLSSGGSMRFNNLTVGFNNPLVIDLDKKSATVGGVSVFGKKTGDWIEPDRKQNTYSFSADAYGGNAYMKVSTYDSF
jgi:hypothetical protein